MIVLVLSEEWNEKRQKNEILVSHGIDTKTDMNIVMSCEPLSYYMQHSKATFNTQLGEWTIDD